MGGSRYAIDGPKTMHFFNCTKVNCLPVFKRPAKVNIVLEGHASSYPTNPIDEWIGGVHVSSEVGNVWMHDGDRLRKIPVD